MTVKYVLFPGWVTSTHDGQRHWVSASDLVRLYGVNRAECVEYPFSKHLQMHWGWPDGAKALQPRADGRYQVPA